MSTGDKTDVLLGYESYVTLVITNLSITGTVNTLKYIILVTHISNVIQLMQCDALFNLHLRGS